MSLSDWFDNSVYCCRWMRLLLDYSYSGKTIKVEKIHRLFVFSFFSFLIRKKSKNQIWRSRTSDLCIQFSCSCYHINWWYLLSCLNFGLIVLDLLLKDYSNVTVDVTVMKCPMCLFILTKCDRTLKEKSWLGVFRYIQSICVWSFNYFLLFSKLSDSGAVPF